jgi:hypothetical protein
LQAAMSGAKTPQICSSSHCGLDPQSMLALKVRCFMRSMDPGSSPG